MQWQETLIMLARTMAGFATVLGGWLAIQALVRRHSGCGRDKDPLDYMPNGCAGCAKSAAGQCSKRRNAQKEHHHELA